MAIKNAKAATPTTHVISLKSLELLYTLKQKITVAQKHMHARMQFMTGYQPN